MSGKPVAGVFAGIAVAEALGLNPKQVSEIHLHYTCDDVVRAEVRLLVHDSQHDRFVSVLREYMLVGRDEAVEEDAA